MSAEFQRAKSNRLAFLAVGFTLMAGLLLARLVHWQVLRRYDVLQASAGGGPSLDSVAMRGTIYDAHGHSLAIPSVVYDVGATPRMITDPLRVAALLAPLLEVSEAELAATLSEGEAEYVSLARNLPIAKGQAIRELGLLGLKLDGRPGRFYPEGNLAAATLGFVNSERHGYYGLEEWYEVQLRGADGFEMAGGPQVLFDLPILQAPHHGMDLVLTLNRVVQRAAERHLEQALEEYGAQSGTIVVMDPDTGAVLALAVAPGYDPNRYGDVPSLDVYVNSAISEQYEPGSVFKLVTIAAALDAGVIRPDDTYYDEGRIVVGERTFMNWDRKAYGQATMTDILARSLNVGAVLVAQKVGTTRFYDAVRRFGFGKPTGIDLAGEIAGVVRYPGSPDWYPADLAANSFGQGLAVTPMQMVQAVAALANDGVLMKPYVVDRIMQDGKVVWQATPQEVRRVVSAETARTLNAMLAEALPRETPLGVVPHYTAAGKTGTSQIVEGGRYDEQAVIASFAGFVPADDPRFVVLVKLDRPQRAPWGSQSAAPVWSSLAGELCAYLGIPPDGVRVAGG